jgi:hypothetical protein
MPVQSEMDTDEEYSQPAELHHQEAISAVGTIWRVRNLEFAGILRFCADPHPCYVREEMLCFWKALCKEYYSYENPVCAICGDSGVGKSIVLFAWAMWLVTVQQQTVLWVSAFEDALVTITVVIAGKATTVVPYEIDPVAIVNILLQSYSEVPVRAILLDGFVQDMSAAVTHIRSCFRESFIVHCSSVGNLKPIECNNETVNMKHHFMCGWSVDDLLAAWRAGRANQAALFPPEVIMGPKLFLRQLYYAGGSYRYMQLPVTCVKDILHYSSDLVGSIGNFTKLLLPQQDVLTAPVYLVTHVRLGGTLRAVPLSSYVAPCMAQDTTDIDAISTLRSVLPDHPMWQGWCFELYLLTIYHTAARVNYATGRVGSAGGCIEGVRVNCGVLRASYNPKRFEPFKIIPYADCQHLKRITHDGAVCYQPERWHDDLFSLAYVCASSDPHKIKVAFLYSCVEATRSFNLVYAAQFLQRLWPRAELPVECNPEHLSNDDLFLDAEKEIEHAIWMGTLNGYCGDGPPPCDVEACAGPTEPATAVQIQVRLYVIAPECVARRLSLRDCTFENAAAVQRFDPAFKLTKVTVCYTRFKAGGDTSLFGAQSEGRYT